MTRATTSQEGIEIGFRFVESDNGLSVTDASFTIPNQSIYRSHLQWTGKFADGLATGDNQNFIILAHEKNRYYETNYQLQCTLLAQNFAHCEASTTEFDLSSDRTPDKYYGEDYVGF